MGSAARANAAGNAIDKISKPSSSILNPFLQLKHQKIPITSKSKGQAISPFTVNNMNHSNAPQTAGKTRERI